MKFTPIVVLIAGAKRSGKDYLATYIKENYPNLRVDIDWLANPLKDIVANLFNISRAELDTFKNNEENYGIEIKAYPNNQPQCTIAYMSFREILQRLGTEAVKPILGNDVWTKILAEHIAKSNAHIFIVPDFRFTDEYTTIVNTLPSSNVFTVNVIPYRNCDSGVPVDSHISENELISSNFNFDYTFRNTTDAEMYKLSVLRLVSVILKDKR